MEHFKEWWDNLEPWEPWVYALIIVALCVGSFTCFSKWSKDQIKTVQTEYIVESKQVKEVTVNGAKVKKFCLQVRVNEKEGNTLTTVVVSPTEYKKSEEGKPTPFQVRIDRHGKVVSIKYAN